MEAGARLFGRKSKPADYMFQGVGVVEILPELQAPIPFFNDADPLTCA